MTRTKVKVALLVLPGVKLHLVADSELVYLGLRGNCGKWEHNGWLGSKGPLAHVDLWSVLWNQWFLHGDSVSVPWVPSHVGVEGNERADEGAIRGWGEDVLTS